MRRAGRGTGTVKTRAEVEKHETSKGGVFGDGKWQGEEANEVK
jgi:hypothetical protein